MTTQITFLLVVIIACITLLLMHGLSLHHNKIDDKIRTDTIRRQLISLSNEVANNKMSNKDIFIRLNRIIDIFYT